jgi:acyl carrier protein
MSDLYEADVLRELSVMILEIMGPDFAMDGEITMETRFSGDLELESIEFIVLAEKVQKKYGKKGELIQWFASKDLSEMIALKVGDLVRYLVHGK